MKTRPRRDFSRPMRRRATFFSRSAILSVEKVASSFPRQAQASGKGERAQSGEKEREREREGSSHVVVSTHPLSDGESTTTTFSQLVSKDYSICNPISDNPCGLPSTWSDARNLGWENIGLKATVHHFRPSFPRSILRLRIFWEWNGRKSAR